MAKQILKIATAQFPLSGRIKKNTDWMLSLMTKASRKGAKVMHFSETALPGYLGVDTDAVDFDQLKEATKTIQLKSRSLKIWTLLGSCHPRTGGRQPFNCVYVIDPKGLIVGRYDKRFCTGGNGRVLTGDLKHYSPGNHFTTFTVNGLKCGILICHDFRYPELYRAYKKLGIDILFHSFHNAHQKKAPKPDHNYWEENCIAGAQYQAGANYFWVSFNNSSRRYSLWPSFVVKPDGIISAKLPRHKTDLIITKIDPMQKFYDASASWRKNAMKGILHSGKLS